MRFGFIAREAARVAQEEAKEVTRVAALKVVFGVIAAVFLLATMVFVLVGLYILLKSEIGAVLAAFCLAGGCLLIAVLSLLISLRVQKRTNLAAQKQRVEAIASQAANELQTISPYLVLGAFVLGLIKGKK
ncbi:hypothetical protein J3R80_05630 [Aliiroseovarius sp. Z3]|uniref:hypothetical protein n=1 Tax=Aliiroseovarius sp. Z3 TaxID=2811402 RepID=UPI0023B2C07C|nr:hypothetical protein [Aliiroseovarius sp. Z3]MDE9449948.1 hypothetical protein [Aliiroseovarius sp. Z3]